jgi:fructose-1,6-bisphosphatase-3
MPEFPNSGTEHFISDVHGEYEAFQHVLKNGSGSIKRKIDGTFPDLPLAEKRALANLIYYPEEELPLILQNVADEVAWYRNTLLRLLKLCRMTASKYTRSRVRQFLPDDFTDLIDELMHQQEEIENRRDYYESIIETVIATGNAGDFIIALAELIQQLAIARLHVLGDVYDRGPGAHLIMDTLSA